MKLCDVRRKPYTVAELYSIVKEKLKKDGNWPDGIETDSAGSADVEIINDTFSVVPQVYYGSNEGIWLDVFLVGYKFTSEDTEKVRLCSARTLEKSREAMRRMAVLGADIEVDLTEFLDFHLENLDRVNYSVREVDENNYLGFGRCTESLELAEKYFQFFKDSGEHVVLLEKGTKKILKEYDPKNDVKETK